MNILSNITNLLSKQPIPNAIRPQTADGFMEFIGVTKAQRKKADSATKSALQDTKTPMDSKGLKELEDQLVERFGTKFDEKSIAVTIANRRANIGRLPVQIKKYRQQVKIWKSKYKACQALALSDEVMVMARQAVQATQRSVNAGLIPSEAVGLPEQKSSQSHKRKRSINDDNSDDDSSLIAFLADLPAIPRHSADAALEKRFDAL